MKLLIIGGTGTLGRQVVRHALDQNYEVCCLVRSLNRGSFLKEWGAELVKGDLCEPETIVPALEGIDAVIDAATTRITDSLSVKAVDWEGKVNLIQAVKNAGIDRYIFFSILNAQKHPEVPLMEIKHCTELFLAESGLNYTTLRLGGFMQGLIAQYAIPILDNQVVWITGESTPIAYMNTQDIAKFAIRALEVPETEKQTFPVVGTRAWEASEIMSLCERLSGENARISRVSLTVLRLMRRVTRFFQWGQNTADRLTFAEVFASGNAFDAEMKDVYQTFGIAKEEITTLEEYMDEYFTRIMKKLKEIDYEKNRNKKKKKKPTKPYRNQF
ncbi:putative nucleoside-diphosphate sugar epimerase [Xenococcus sp. PCC 7305]|uniref:SDR family oxidoreductase n=1 Tax=Xenococcus sp. PCC 7305 TaxID=102125 RepID=UPI0002AC1E2B|nr:SDR family oxidoreductase [Xenococcus sp. PCC 7305]ELS01896.1 putative nucleoside-diphosphate sugar epimerase [Xenococcus sp. PCC 7305]